MIPITTFRHILGWKTFGKLLRFNQETRAKCTNIAKALQQDPSIAQGVQRLYFMGGANIHNNHLCYLYRAHNCKVDPEAISIINDAAKNVKGKK